MTIGGWIFMILSWGFILTLVIYTFIKVLTTHKNEKNAKRT